MKNLAYPFAYTVKLSKAVAIISKHPCFQDRGTHILTCRMAGETIPLTWRICNGVVESAKEFADLLRVADLECSSGNEIIFSSLQEQGDADDAHCLVEAYFQREKAQLLKKMGEAIKRLEASV